VVAWFTKSAVQHTTALPEGNTDCIAIYAGQKIVASCSWYHSFADDEVVFISQANQFI
jgi:hypothetical protein